MSSEHFLLVLRRFIAHRGTPRELLSDNAPQFQVANTVLTNLWSSATSSDSDVQTYCAEQGISWRFIPAKAPWMGGVYERLVSLVKRSLCKTLGRSLLRSDQLATLLVEIEAMINTQPLLYVPSDETQPTLSPADFLQQHTSVNLPALPTDADDDPDYQPRTTERPPVATQLLATWKKGQRILDGFWRQWKFDYVTSLREMHRAKLHVSHPPAKRDAKWGDVVLVHDTLPRGVWKMGKIVALPASRDGNVRSAEVRLSNGHTITRPLNALYPLEATVGNPAAATSTVQTTTTCLRRSTRTAADHARRRLANKDLY